MRLGLTPIHLELTLEQVEHLRDALRQRSIRLHERKDKTEIMENLMILTDEIIKSIDTQLYGE